MTALYVITDGAGRVKVGRATNPVQRLAQHRFSTGADLVGVALFDTENAAGDEATALSFLSLDHEGGEWFRGDPAKAVEEISAALGRPAVPFPDAPPRRGPGGRPPIAQRHRRTQRLVVMLNAEEEQAYSEAAKGAGAASLSDWVRSLLSDAARKQARKA